MITTDKLKEFRKRAQDAVSDMTEGELKTKAFEIFLHHLLNTETQQIPHPLTPSSNLKPDKSKTTNKSGSNKSRILLLKDEGFFAIPRSISEVKFELQAHGWMHPTTSLSGPLQSLVRERQLRRVKDPGSKQKVWKYINP